MSQRPLYTLLILFTFLRSPSYCLESESLEKPQAQVEKPQGILNQLPPDLLAAQVINVLQGVFYLGWGIYNLHASQKPGTKPDEALSNLIYTIRDCINRYIVHQHINQLVTGEKAQGFTELKISLMSAALLAPKMNLSNLLLFTIALAPASYWITHNAQQLQGFFTKNRVLDTAANFIKGMVVGNPYEPLLSTSPNTTSRHTFNGLFPVFFPVLAPYFEPLGAGIGDLMGETTDYYYGEKSARHPAIVAKEMLNRINSNLPSFLQHTKWILIKLLPAYYAHWRIHEIKLAHYQKVKAEKTASSSAPHLDALQAKEGSSPQPQQPETLRSAQTA